MEKMDKRILMKKEKEQKPTRSYDTNFVVTEDYKASMPDMQNADSAAIRGANVPIIQVGSSNFKLPLHFKTQNGESILLEASVSGTVSLGKDAKGINMSRIVRTFYEYKDQTFTPELLENILTDYKKNISSERAWIKLSFSYPMIRKSLRSGLEGYQYYQCAYEGLLDEKDNFTKILHFDYIYSSSCPCSMELSEHARDSRNIYGIPHSQRSTARIRVNVESNQTVSFEDLHAMCLKGIPTETQVMVKREDEQAFAELNGANAIFVEDAVRLLFQQFEKNNKIQDFEIACSHLESLHSHDAVAVVAKGLNNGFRGDFTDYHQLIR